MSHTSFWASGFYFYFSKIFSLPWSKPISHARFWERSESKRDQELYVVSFFLIWLLFIRSEIPSSAEALSIMCPLDGI